MTTLDIKRRIAKKQHKCNFCNGTIEVGEKYKWIKNVFDGEIYEWKSHTSCDKLVSVLGMYDRCDDEVTEEDFRESIQDEYQLIMPTQYKEEFEAEGFSYPPFSEQLAFVKKQHNISD